MAKNKCRTTRKNAAGQFDCRAGVSTPRGACLRSHEIKAAVEVAERKIADLLPEIWTVKYVGPRDGASIESAVAELLFLDCIACFLMYLDVIFLSLSHSLQVEAKKIGR